RELFASRFGGDATQVLSVPGRINLIGEHIDYHDLPVMPIAVQRRIEIAFRANDDRVVRIESAGYSPRCRVLHGLADANRTPGDWGNYLSAAVAIAATHWPLTQGIDAVITSDLPPAAGLSSSSAVLIGITLALLAANGVGTDFNELMNVFPEGEQLVGTRGGGMDHAAILGASPGSALLIRFAPLELKAIPAPVDWAFLAAHSLTTAEKSGSARAEYNSRREAGSAALLKTGFSSFREALRYPSGELTRRARQAGLNPDELGCFLHVISEAERVEGAVTAMERADAEEFGNLLCASHASLRDQLCVSNPALDELAACAMQCGATGARLTGAGFGGYVIILCTMANRERVRAGLVERFYSGRAGFDSESHLFFAEPSAGVLFA
ncbi:MAG: hypothetical protein JO270_05480, partial [Acidobacteriaceae bacterium]|nr:hypothetical protein [Acidobacteriaceae bacterium]